MIMAEPAIQEPAVQEPSATWAATFGSEADLLSALGALRTVGHPVREVYTPYPVHGLDAAMDLRPSRLGRLTFVAGAAGCALALAFQSWTSAVDWPINVGGKPDLSIPAFIPITFEVTILFAGLATAAGLLARSKLFPGKRAAAPAPRVTDDRFVVSLTPANDPARTREIETLLRTAGCLAIDHAPPAPAGTAP
jgi:hypothetical protein